MSDHLRSNLAVIERFLPVRIECRQQAENLLLVECRPSA